VIPPISRVLSEKARLSQPKVGAAPPLVPPPSITTAALAIALPSSLPLGELSRKERQRRSRTVRGQAGGERRSRGAGRSAATAGATAKALRQSSLHRKSVPDQKQIGPPAGGPLFLAEARSPKAEARASLPPPARPFPASRHVLHYHCRWPCPARPAE